MNSGRTRLVIIIIVAIILYYVIKQFDLINRIKRLFEPRFIDYSCNPTGGTMKIADNRIAYLNNVAQRIYDDIYNTPYTGHDCKLYTEANQLCDEELAYVAQQYRKALTRGLSIYTDLDSQWTIACDFDSLRAHLSKVGET